MLQKCYDSSISGAAFHQDIFTGGRYCKVKTKKSEAREEERTFFAWTQ